MNKKKEIMQTSIKKNFLLNLTRTFLSIVFPLITFPYASRILLPAGIGKINFAQSIVSYFSLIAGLGIGMYGIREAAKIRDNKLLLSKLTCELWHINLFSTILAYILFIFVFCTVEKLHSYKDLLFICSSTILLTTIGFEWLYGALEKYKYITFRSFFFQLLSLVLLIVLVKVPEDYIKYASISVIATVGANTLNFIHIRKFINLKYIKGLNHSKHIKPIFLLFGMTIITSIYTLLDTTMLGFFSTDAEIGIYNASIKINRIVLTLIISLNTVLFPRLSFYIANGEKKKFDLLIIKGVNFILFFSLPATVGLFLLAEPVILFFCGEQYIDAIPVMKIMTSIIINVSLSNLIGIQLFLPLNREKLTLISVCLGASINFILNIFLIKKFGALGAGIATICAQLLVTCSQLLFARKYVSIRNSFQFVYQYILSSLIMGIGIYFVIKNINNVILQIIFSIFFGCILYATSILLQKNPFAREILQIIKRKQS